MLVEVTDQAYPPFSFVNDKGEVEGFDIDIAKEFAKRLGVGLNRDAVLGDHCRG
jgi:polar amino acid transport system substrate-binding protein